MFTDEKYILVDEITELTGIKRNVFVDTKIRLQEQGDFTSICKSNGVLLVNKYSNNLTEKIYESIREARKKQNPTSLKNKISLKYFTTEFSISRDFIKNRREGDCDMILGTEKIAGTEFIVFDMDFVRKMQDRHIYVLNRQETEQCYEAGDIDGYCFLTYDRFLTWYYVD